jgi:hypothetical protein
MKDDALRELVLKLAELTYFALAIHEQTNEPVRKSRIEHTRNELNRLLAKLNQMKGARGA